MLNLVSAKEKGWVTLANIRKETILENNQTLNGIPRETTRPQDLSIFMKIVDECRLAYPKLCRVLVRRKGHKDDYLYSPDLAVMIKKRFEEEKFKLFLLQAKCEADGKWYCLTEVARICRTTTAKLKQILYEKGRASGLISVDGDKWKIHESFLPEIRAEFFADPELVYFQNHEPLGLSPELEPVEDDWCSVTEGGGKRPDLSWYDNLAVQ